MRTLVEALVTDAIAAARADGALAIEGDVAPCVERPRDAAHGDWASSVAMRLAKQAHMSPRAIAETLVEHMQVGGDIASIDIAGPGFINVTLSPRAWQRAFADARSLDTAYGSSNVGGGARVDLEFVSANPTGPMHLGHGRWAALGDALGNVLAFCGYDVTREFYINDAGNQMDVFAASVAQRYLQIARLVGQGCADAYAARDRILEDAEAYRAELPENCYAGAYVVDIAARIYADEGDAWVEASAHERAEHLKERAYTAVLEHVQSVLEGFGLHFDVWFSERTLHALDEDGTTKISRTIRALEQAGCLYEQDGATWFATTRFGDDKDRVLVKGDGAYTYFAPDIAYHNDKFERGYERCIDLLGADHHGYIKRIQAAGEVLGHPGQPEVIIGQMVNLFRDGEPVRMSKRTGEMVTFEELIDEVGPDATRFLMLSRSTDQTIDFDIAQAKRQDASNPVYYVQYAHARICSLFARAARERGLDASGTPDELAAALVGESPDLSVLVHPAEIALAKRIDEFSGVVAGCARDCAPFRLTHYVQSLAQEFHQFYTQCHVITDDERLTAARLAAADATRIVLGSALRLLGVSAPKSM